MATSGIFVSISIPAPVAPCVVSLTCTLDAQSNGSDFGSNASCSLFMTQSGTTSYGATRGFGGSNRAGYTMQYSFTLAAGAPAVVGVNGGIGGAASLAVWNLDLKAEVIKR